MRASWVLRAASLAAVGAAAGCTPPGPNLKSPVAEQYAVPPEDDPRFSSPLAYPKETLNREPPKSTVGQPKMPSQMPSIAPGGRGPGVGF
jgi:hypothetical protein